MAPLISSATEAGIQLVARLYNHNPYYYNPNFGANLAALIVLAIVTVGQIAFSIKYRQWWFGVFFCAGLILEVAGYVGRVLAHNNFLQPSYFMLQIIAITMAPSLLMAAVYSLPAKYAIVYGDKTSPIKPMWYSYLFISLDLFAISLQGAGGGICSSASNKNESTQAGTNVMIGGLVVQVVSMAVFFGFCAHFIYRVRQRSKELRPLFPDVTVNDGFDPKFQHIRNRKYFIPLVWASGFTCLFIFIRSIFRCVELGLGWGNHLMANEVSLLVLETLMIVLAVIPVTLVHPGLALGSGNIVVRSAKNKNKNGGAVDEEDSVEDSSMVEMVGNKH